MDYKIYQPQYLHFINSLTDIPNEKNPQDLQRKINILSKDCRFFI